MSARAKKSTSNTDDVSKEESPNTGDKHDIAYESSESKRPKTRRQTKIDEVFVGKNDNTSTNEKREENEAKDGAKDSEAKHNNRNKKFKGADPEQGSAVHTEAEKDVPSAILEKGIIYFFVRGRVGIDEPDKVDEVARTHIILRPVPRNAKLGKGTIGDVGNTRLLALPKKVLPTSGKDRFLAFVEKSGASFDEIKKEFLFSMDYETKTAGTRHKPAPAPVGEGVYSITSTGNESHLAYILTLPEKIGSAQEDLGLKERASFIMSTKNPQYSGPANTQLPDGPDFPQE